MRRENVFPSTYYNSKVLLSSGPVLLTIDFAAIEPVGQGADKQDKLVLHFKEPNSRLLVVTPTKYDAISLIAGSDDTDGWPGTQMVLEAGKVPFQGKLVDSIGIRAPRRPPPQQAANPQKPPGPTAAVAEPDFEDELDEL